jgi:hypothetical protein
MPAREKKISISPDILSDGSFSVQSCEKKQSGWDNGWDNGYE